VTPLRPIARSPTIPLSRYGLLEGNHAFLGAGEASLKTRPADGRDFEIGRLKAKVGDLTMANELLEVKIEHLEAGRPLARRRSRR
jgi:transposase